MCVRERAWKERGQGKKIKKVEERESSGTGIIGEEEREAGKVESETDCKQK